MPKRKRSRNITWFNPPFSQNVQLKIGREFLRLLDTHFPKSSRLRKIFNRNTVKVSYSCLKNVKSVIANHNNKILTQKPMPPTPSEKMCNCRNFNLCPLENKCLTKSIVYKASVTEENSNDTKVYIGSTSTTLKERFRNHKKSIANPLYATNTELSKYVWSLKEKNKKYNIKWDIVKQVPSYKSGGKQCSLCSNEKLYILKAEKGSILNKRSELSSRCIHQRRFLARKFNQFINLIYMNIYGHKIFFSAKIKKGHWFCLLSFTMKHFQRFTNLVCKQRLNIAHIHRIISSQWLVCKRFFFSFFIS